VKRTGPGAHHGIVERVTPRPRPAVDPLEEPVRRFLLTGDEEALDHVVRETRLRLLAAASRIGAPQDAEDSVQTAYLSLVRKRGEALGAPVFPWLLTAVIRTAYRRKAQARREEDLARRLARPLSGPSPFTIAAGREIGERIGRAVERLPAAYRDPVVLHYLSGLPTAETARLLDLPEATVRTRLRRARLLLRSRVPAGLVQAAWIAAWFLWDAVKGGGSALGPAAMGGVAMKAGGIAGVVVLAAALGAAAGAALFGGPKTPPGPAPEEVATQVRAAADSARAEAEGARRKVEVEAKALQAERDEARARAEKAEQDAAAARREIEELKAATATAKAGAETAPPKPGGPRFALGEYEAVLKDLDWDRIGTNMKAMVPLLEDLAARAAKKEPMDGAALGKIQQLNGPLVEAAFKIGDRIPGMGLNAKFTHPVFASNAIAAALASASLPLTERQAEALAKIAQEFTDRDRARIAGYDDRSWMLQKVLDEADLRDAFFDAAFAVLAPEQRAALKPEATKGLVGLDLFSAGLVWQQHLAPVTAPDKAGVLAVLRTQVATQLGIPEDKREGLTPLLAEWVEAVPAAWLEGEMGMMGIGIKAEEIEALARVQLSILRRIADNPAFGDAAAGKARRIGAVLMPVRS
jgi:RNA polymerase sigma factor (sigma-70 family)